MIFKQKDGLSFPSRTEVSAVCTRVWMGREAKANKSETFMFNVKYRKMYKITKQRKIQVF